jgi:hypothetical protein
VNRSAHDNDRLGRCHSVVRCVSLINGLFFTHGRSIILSDGNCPLALPLFPGRNIDYLALILHTVGERDTICISKATPAKDEFAMCSQPNLRLPDARSSPTHLTWTVAMGGRAMQQRKQMTPTQEKRLAAR